MRALTGSFPRQRGPLICGNVIGQSSRKDTGYVPLERQRCKRGLTPENVAKLSAVDVRNSQVATVPQALRPDYR